MHCIRSHVKLHIAAETLRRLSFLLMIWTNGVGASTGMFVPALAIGATGGRMFGRGVKLLVQCALLDNAFKDIAFWTPAYQFYCSRYGLHSRGFRM